MVYCLSIGVGCKPKRQQLNIIKCTVSDDSGFWNYCWWPGNLSPNTVFCWLECWLLSKNKWDCIKQQKVNLWVLKTRKYSKKKMCDIQSYIPIIILKCSAAIHNYSLLTHWVFVFRCTNPSLHSHLSATVVLTCCAAALMLYWSSIRSFIFSSVSSITSFQPSTRSRYLSSDWLRSLVAMRWFWMSRVSRLLVAFSVVWVCETWSRT